MHSGRVGRWHIAGQPVAFGQDLIDLMDLPLAVTRRRTEAQRRGEPRTARLDGPGPPARKAPGLARQVFKRELDGGEAAAQGHGIDGVIGDRVILLILGGGRRASGLKLAEQRNPRTKRHVDDTYAGLRRKASGRAAIGPNETPAPVDNRKDTRP